MLILNSGGTFNKRYNKLNGVLDVPFDNTAVEKILSSVTASFDIAGIVYKDSLDINANDRKIIADVILESNDNKFIIIHGTDTMKDTAEFLNEIFSDKCIVLTGAMKPFEIDNIEASVNLGMSIGFLEANRQNGIYICMNGMVKEWQLLSKNTAIGQFELVE